MKRFCAGLCLMVSCCVPALAHPPSRIDLSLEKDMLTVTAAHQVRDPQSHFIDDVTVAVNGKRAVVQQCWAQADAQAQYAAYRIPGLKKSDKIVVSADCNLGGGKKQELIVP